MSDTDDWAERTEQLVLDAALKLAPAQGWTRAMTLQAAQDCGLGRGDAELLLPHGPADLAALLSRRHDATALRALESVDSANLTKMRARITRAAQARVEAAAAEAPATRRWAAYLAWPMNLPLALRLAWESADVIWRWAGDRSADENHYSKRAILSGILISTLAVRLAEGEAEADRFLAARIDNVMAFEAWKAGRPRPGDLLREFAAALGRLRYR